MKKRGLLTGLILGVFVFAALATAQDVSVFTFEKPEFDNKFGIQVAGSGSMFMMEDVNDFRASTLHLENANDAEMGIGWSFALLYRSHERFRWTIGYNWLGQDKADAAWLTENNTTGFNEIRVTGSEFFVTGNYLIPVTERLHLSVGGGMTLVNASMDRTSTAAESFYDASGRAIGLRAQLGAEFLLTRAIGISLNGGYRMANVGSLTYEDRDGTESDVYWGGGNRTLGADFSGPFGAIGLSYYFEPATEWFKM